MVLLGVDLRVYVGLGLLKGGIGFHEAKNVKPLDDGWPRGDRDAGCGGTDVDQGDEMVADVPGIIDDGRVQDARRPTNGCSEPDVVESACSTVGVDISVGFQAGVPTSERVDGPSGKQIDGQ